ncbi:MAG: hypothetical protein JJU02_02375 [Cryomorphaceae bacterium]|nr:hypothetical protein [Cryomorphaceae bacterium]
MALKLRIITLVIISLTIASANAQRVEIGATGGGTNFIGDVGNNGFHMPNSWYAGGFFRTNFNPYWSMRVSFNRGHVWADDAESSWDWRKHRNLRFESEITEISLWFEFNFFEFDGRKKNAHSFYIFGGVGLFFFDPMTEYEGEMVRLQPLGTEGQNSSLSNQPAYPLSDYILPFGLGYKYAPNMRFTIGIEVGFRRTGTDFLDDVSGYYVDNELLAQENGPVAAALADRTGDGRTKNGQLRGNPNRDDWYIFSGITLSFKLYSAREKCAKF